MSNAFINIAEDESIVALDLKNILSKAGYTINSISTTGEEAVRRAEFEKPDLILLDIFLKGQINGSEASKIIPEF